MCRLMNNLRTEKDEIIREGGNERSAVRIRVQDKSKHQKRGEDPQKPESQHDPKAERLRNEDVSDQPPDFAVANARRIKIKRETEIGIQPHQRPHQRGEANHNPDQSWNAKKAETAFEFIQQSHVCRSVRFTRLVFKVGQFTE